MGETILLIEKSEGIATITMNRPKAMNALSSGLLSAIVDAFKDLENDQETRAVILTGTGKAFCGGLDLKEVASVTGSFDMLDIGKGTYQFFDTLNNFDRPLIGAINGAAITGGFEMALACDMLIASTEARFADTHARVGIMPSAGISQKLSRMIGINRAKELSLTGNFLDARKAEAWGLVNRVVAPESLIPVCRELARDIVSNDQNMVKEYKQLINQGHSLSLSEGLALEMERHLRLAQAGIQNFDALRQDEVQKRGSKQILK